MEIKVNKTTVHEKKPDMIWKLWVEGEKDLFSFDEIKGPFPATVTGEITTPPSGKRIFKLEEKQEQTGRDVGPETPKVEEKAIVKPPGKQEIAWVRAIRDTETKFFQVSGNERKTKVELGFAVQLIEKSPQLQKCTPRSIANAVMNVARMDITLNPAYQHAHLVAHGDQCVIYIDYKGLVFILTENGCVKHIECHIVYDDERFQPTMEPNRPHDHEIKYAKTEEEQKRRGIKGVYSVVVLPDGSLIYTELMPYWHVLKVEKSSTGAGSKFSPWNNWRESMIKKSKIRNDFKLISSGSPNERIAAALEVDDETSGFSDEKRRYVVDTDYEEIDNSRRDANEKLGAL